MLKWDKSIDHWNSITLTELSLFRVIVWWSKVETVVHPSFEAAMELLIVVNFNFWRPSIGIWFWIALVILLHNSGGILSASDYLIGLGSNDTTRPATNVNMMGYTNTE